VPTFGNKSYAFGQINTHITFEKIGEDRVKATTKVNGTDFEHIAEDEVTAARELKTLVREKALQREL
jgi:hypothetical protein